MVHLVDVFPVNAAFRRATRPILAERQFIVRADGRIRCANLNRFAPMGLAVVVAASLDWLIYASQSHVRLSAEALDKDRRID